MTMIGTKNTTIEDVKEKVLDHLKNNTYDTNFNKFTEISTKLEAINDDKIWIDLYKLSRFDLSVTQKYLFDYCTTFMNFYDQRFSIYKEYYVNLFELFYNLRSTYLFGRIYGSQPTDIMVRIENRIFEDVLQEMHNIYMCNLSPEMQSYYYFIQNNDPYGMAKYFTDNFGYPNKKEYDSVINQICSELEKFRCIPFVRNSPVSVQRTLNEFTKIYKRYLKDSGLYDKYFEKYISEYNKSEAKICKDIFEAFLESDINSISYFYNLNYPQRDYNKDKMLVEHFCPDLYLRFSEKISTEQSKRYAIICDVGRKLRDAIIKEKYKLSILDFLRIYNYDTPDGLDYYKKTIVPALPDDCKKIINSYLRKINMNPIIQQAVYNSVICCNGKYLVQEDKTRILNYIRTNNLPYIESVYMAIYREYLNDKLDLDKPFK